MIRFANYLLFLLLTLSCNESSVQDAETQSSEPSSSGQYGEKTKIFRNNSLSLLDGIKKGPLCGSIKNGEISLESYEWSSKLISYLTSELEKFPLYNDIKIKTKGIYLSKFNNDDINGIACIDGSDNSYVIFLNADTLITPRSSHSSFDSSSYIYKNSGFFDEVGDLLLHTLFHELFHIVDYSKYIDVYKGAYLENARKEFSELSWENVENELSNPIDKYEIEYDTASVQYYKALANTNFVTDNATANIFEDFATSLEVYYMLSRYDSKRSTQFYSEMFGEDYTWDVKEIVSSNPQLKNKLCQIAEIVLEEKCRL